MTCWRCGRADHAEWCSMPGGCGHCGWDPCRWWCMGEDVDHGWFTPTTSREALSLRWSQEEVA